jgi:hypothetical protein
VSTTATAETTTTAAVPGSPCCGTERHEGDADY